MNLNNKPLHFTVLTLFPELIENYLSEALLAKAIQNKNLSVQVVSLRPFAEGAYRSIDDVPYGGGDGMLMKAQCLEKAIDFLKKEISIQKLIYLSPQGQTWTHQLAKNKIQQWTSNQTEAGSNLPDSIVLLCGRYAGIDQRFIQKFVDEEISIGDYVLSGGELAALVMIESVSRYLPGVLGDKNSWQQDSFEKGWLEAPQFTKPQIWNELSVPPVLLSGNHAKISEWKKNCEILMTFKKRPDLFKLNIQNQKIEVRDVQNFYQSLSSVDRKLLGLENLDLSEMLK